VKGGDNIGDKKRKTVRTAGDPRWKRLGTTLGTRGGKRSG
jgi:hypothetical protein